MLPLKKRDRISHPSGTQNGPFACACTFFMLYFKLINRESGGYRDPATQRMNGSLWQPPCFLYIFMYKSNRPSCSCACTNLFLYISLILSYLHNGEREGIKDGDGGLTFQRKDGPPLQSSDLYLMDSKESLIIFSCIILMPYADLRTRESDGDRGLAIQRIDGPLHLYGNHQTHTQEP